MDYVVSYVRVAPIRMPKIPTNIMQKFLFSLTWFLALLIPAMSLLMILYIQISIWLDKRYALKEIRKAKTGLGD